MHDDSMWGNGKEGYIITDIGIYSQGNYISWNKFINGKLCKEKEHKLSLNGENFICHIMSDETTKRYIIDQFFFELQKYLQEKIYL